MTNTVTDVIYLAGCAVNDTVPEKARVAGMDLNAVYSFASRHMITSAVAFALESAGVKDERSGKAIASALRRTVLFEKEWGEIKSKLEQAGIWYMPLKGAVLKNIYPKYGMREFADHDILFDASRALDVKQIMEALGYTADSFGYDNNDAYFKAPLFNFEMHRMLLSLSSEDRLFEYYTGVEDRLVKENGYERRFTPEDFYLFFLVHEYKHYANEGTGLRSLLDTYVYLSKVPLDMAYIAAELDKLGLVEFEKNNRSLSIHLFGGEELTEAEQEMLDYIVSSGTYGTIANRIQNNMKKRGGSKIRYLLNRLYIPVSKKNREYAIYAYRYPLFYKYRIMLPFLPFYRIIQAIKHGRFRTEVKAIQDFHTRKG